MKHVLASLVSLATLGLCGVTSAQSTYAVPKTDAATLRGVDFASAQVILPDFTQVLADCDKGRCKADPNTNTTILQFPDGTVFFDAKMAIDADGSALSKKHEFPNQPETALRYPTTDTSLDSERVPYIVLPIGSMRQTTGASVGDLAAVMKDGQVHFAIVGDVGPRDHLGEGSMKLHMAFGRQICTAYDADRNCRAFTDTSLDAPVLYFVFPNTRARLFDGLSPENVNQRIETIGRSVWAAFLQTQRDPKVETPARRPAWISGVMEGNQVGGPPASYPLAAKAAGIEGAVVLEGLLSEEGRMTFFRVVSGPPELRQAAVDYLDTARYVPYKYGGHSIAGYKTVTLGFHLGDDKEATMAKAQAELARLKTNPQQEEVPAQQAH